VIRPFKNRFQPRSVLGIQIAPGFVGAVCVQNGLHGPRVSHAAFRDLAGEEDASSALAGLVPEGNLEVGSVLASFPSSRVELRTLEASLHNSKKLARIIKYQVEELVSTPIEETVVDFVSASSNGHVLAAALQKPLLADHLEGLKRAGLDPDRVTLDDLALFALYRHLHRGPKGREALALLRLGPDRGGVQILRNRRLSLFRTLPLGKDMEAALVETLRLDTLRNPDEAVEAVWLTGPDALKPGRTQFLEELLGLPVELWKPLDALREGTAALSEEDQVRLSVPLGLALAANEPLTGRFNLRKEEFTKQTGAPDRRLVVPFLAGLVVLGVLFGVHLHQETRALENRHERIRAEMRETLLETFPETPLVIKGQEPAQMGQKIREQRARFGWLEQLTTDRTVLDLLTTITATLSGHQDVTVDNLSVEEGEIHLDGRASSFQTVDAVKEKFEKETHFRQAKLLSAKSEKGQGGVKFSFVLETAK
jgi:type II secretion system protein L